MFQRKTGRNARASLIAGVILCAAFSSTLYATENPPAPVEQTAAAESLFERVLELNRIQEPELRLEEARSAFRELTARARTALADAQTPKEKVAALSKVLLADREVTYLSNLDWRDATLSASLLRRKGNCISTATLFVLAGEELGLPIHLVVVPGHAFVRWDDGQTRINIETTAGGVELSDREYLNRPPQPVAEDIEALGWGRSLDQQGFLADVMEAAVHHRWGENRLEDALALATRVEQLAPHRVDLKLRHIILQADATGQRAEAREQVARLVQRGGLPPTVHTGALMWMAEEADAERDYEQERRLLLEAFPIAPKSAEMGLLTALAFCHRSLKDYRGAVRYMELAEALVHKLSPTRAIILYNLAILQKNDNHLKEALASIREALQINPEKWNLQMIEAGYLVLSGEREEGLRRFAQIERPREDVEFYENMLAWFYAVSRQRDKFYAQFEHALDLAHSPRVLVWLGQDVDLDVYRDEPEFKALVEKHRARILGAQKP